MTTTRATSRASGRASGRTSGHMAARVHSRAAARTPRPLSYGPLRPGPGGRADRVHALRVLDELGGLEFVRTSAPPRASRPRYVVAINGEQRHLVAADADDLIRFVTRQLLDVGVNPAEHREWPATYTPIELRDEPDIEAEPAAPRAATA